MGFTDLVLGILYIPYYVLNAIMLYLLANLVIFFIVIGVILAAIIVLMIVDWYLFLKITFTLLGLLLTGFVIMLTPLVFLTWPLILLLLAANLAGIIMYIVNGPTVPRILFGLGVGPFTGAGILGWAIIERVEMDNQRMPMKDFAVKIGGVLAGYDGQDATDRYKIAIALKPQSKYYAVAQTLVARDDIANTDSGKFWATAQIPDTLFLFEPAYHNLNLSMFGQ